MHRRLFLAEGLSAVVAARRLPDAWIGLFAIAAALLLTVEARGQGSVASDRAVLVAFYRATGGSGWTRSDNWLSAAPISEWYGVGTNHQGRVAILQLHNNQLSGSLPPELGRLKNLRALQLWENRLSGSIPPKLSQATNLQTLGLSDNRLNGPLPPELGRLKNLLRALHLDGNQFSGPIPRELGALIFLETLSLGNNRLSGPIPVELGNLIRLRESRQSEPPSPIDSGTGLCLPSAITGYGVRTTGRRAQRSPLRGASGGARSGSARGVLPRHGRAQLERQHQLADRRAALGVARSVCERARSRDRSELLEQRFERVDPA